MGTGALFWFPYLFSLVYSCCADNSTDNEGNVTRKINWRERVPNEELSQLMESLLLEEETANRGRDWVSINLQGRSPRGSKEDFAPKHLLEIKEEAYSKETIRRLQSLYDNYYPEVNRREEITEEEREEERQFLGAVMETPVFGRMKEFLLRKEVVPNEEFDRTFYRIWFEQYPRWKKSLGSSGFEHVFLGELKKGVSGFHNWIYFGDQEQRENLDYLGYIKSTPFGENLAWMSHSFNWRQNFKPISSMLIGTSPEFEMSLFTVCWFVRPNSKCRFNLNGTRMSIQTYGLEHGGQTFIGSVYVGDASLTAQQEVRKNETVFQNPS